jgi:hypothetical protein
MTKRTKKRVINKNQIKKKLKHPTVPPRMEGVVKNAMLRSKKAIKQVRKPRKSKK